MPTGAKRLGNQRWPRWLLEMTVEIGGCGYHASEFQGTQHTQGFLVAYCPCGRHSAFPPKGRNLGTAIVYDNPNQNENFTIKKKSCKHRQVPLK